MRKCVPYIVGLVVILACVAKWRAYEKPNALQLGVHHLGLAALMAVWGLSPSRREQPGPTGRLAPRWVQPDALLGAYALWVALSPGWAEHATLGFIGASTAVPYALWALLVAHLLRGARERRLCLLFVGLSAGALAAFTFYDAWLGHEAWLNQRQGHQNVLASCLLGGSFAALGGLGALREAVRPRLLRVALCGALGLSALAGVGLLVPASSAGAWVGLAAGAAAFALCFLSPLARRLTLAGAAAALAFVLLALPSVHGFADRLWNHVLAAEQATRLFHLESSLRMFSQRPVLGWGAGNFMSSFADFKQPEAAMHGWQTALTIHPHNEAAQVALETGAVGLLLFALFLAGALLLGWERKGDRTDRWCAAAALGGFAAMVAHGMFTVALSFWGPAAVFWTLAGFVMSWVPPAPGLPARFRKFKAPVAIAGALAILGLITLPGQHAHFLMGKVEDLASAESRVESQIAVCDQLRPLSRYAPQYVRSLIWPAKALYLTDQSERAVDAFERLDEVAPNLGPTRRILGRQYLERYTEHKRPDDLKRAVERLRAYTRKRPDDDAAQTLYARALLAASPRNAPRAAVGLNLALWRNPSNGEARRMLEETRAARGFGPNRP